jgi:hypothetical protein
MIYEHVYFKLVNIHTQYDMSICTKTLNVRYKWLTYDKFRNFTFWLKNGIDQNSLFLIRKGFTLNKNLSFVLLHYILKIKIHFLQLVTVQSYQITISNNMQLCIYHWKYKMLHIIQLLQQLTHYELPVIDSKNYVAQTPNYSEHRAGSKIIFIEHLHFLSK